MSKREMVVILQGVQKRERLDRALRRRFPSWGRKTIGRLISSGKVLVNGQKVWLCSWLVGEGDRLTILEVPAEKELPPQRFDDAWIVSQEDDIIALNKPAGLLSQGTRWREASNLLDLAHARFGPLVLFHRLDRDTSGLVLLTRGSAVNHYLDRAFKQGLVQKEYLAVVQAPNQLADEGNITVRIARHERRRDMMAAVERGGKRAVTRYRIARTQGNEQWVYLWPLTGRTHQLRVHTAYMRAPIIGDRLYAPTHIQGGRLMLHAWRITLPALDGFAERQYEAPLPEGFALEEPRPS